MNSNKDIFERIELYLEDKLSSDERSAFLQEVSDNTDLKKSLELQQAVQKEL